LGDTRAKFSKIEEVYPNALGNIFYLQQKKALERHLARISN